MPGGSVFECAYRVPHIALRAGVGRAPQRHLDLETRFFQRRSHGIELQKAEIERNLLVPPLVQVQHLVADVECDQHAPAGLERAPPLAKCGQQVARVEVDDAVECYDPAQRRVRKRQGAHVGLLETDSRKTLARLLDHSCRQIESDHIRSSIGQKHRDMARPAANVGDRPQVANLLGKCQQQRAIERLAS